MFDLDGHYFIKNALLYLIIIISFIYNFTDQVTNLPKL